MPQQNRIISCDVCGSSQEERDFGTGWDGWCIITGIGAEPPKHGQPIRKRNNETCLCPQCKLPVSTVIDRMQNQQRVS